MLDYSSVAARLARPSEMTYRQNSENVHSFVYMGGEKVNSPDAENSIKVCNAEIVRGIIAAGEAAAAASALSRSAGEDER